MGVDHIRLGILVLAGCYSGTPAETLSNTTRQPAAVLAISEQRVGPIDGKSRATLTGLRDLLVGFEVRPRNVDDGLQFHVFKDGEQLLYVVPSEDGHVFNVHATSGKVSVVDRPWRAGAVFSGAAALTACECWGPNPTCYKRGEHVAVNFDRPCSGLTDGDPRALKVLDGITVQRVIWSVNAFGMDGGEGGEDGGATYGDPCGGQDAP